MGVLVGKWVNGDGEGGIVSLVPMCSKARRTAGALELGPPQLQLHHRHLLLSVDAAVMGKMSLTGTLLLY